jgi:hypothetical protein
MKNFLLVLLSFHFTFEFLCFLSVWINSKSDKEYILRFVDTLFSAAMIFAFIKLVEVL